MSTQCPVYCAIVLPSCKLLHCYNNGITVVMLQVANVSSCPLLVTPTGPYTLHLNVNEQLVISGSNFIQVLVDIVTVCMYVCMH